MLVGRRVVEEVSQHRANKPCFRLTDTDSFAERLGDVEEGGEAGDVEEGVPGGGHGLQLQGQRVVTHAHHQ